MPFDLIIFAVIAVILVLRLGRVLGKRTGHQRPPEFPMPGNDDSVGRNQTPPDEEDNVVRIPTGRDEPKPESPLFDGPAGAGLREIVEADPTFQPEDFLEGARSAFEWIVTAYAEGDRKTLKSLLDEDTYASFAGAIDQREKEGQRMEDTLVGIDSSDIVEAVLNGREARVTVRFVSQQVNVTYDSEGRVLDGDPSHVETVNDVWTFARDITARDPNWQLVETRVAA
ncbi:MAG: Tim44/TimA family putative adaptor protein [Alphaproteobacteria bacterium]